MKRFSYIIISTILLISYIVSVIYLDDVKILAGNITPIVNMSALWGLVAVGLATSVLLFISTTHTFSFLPTNKGEANRRNIYLLLAVLALFRITAFFLSPDFIQYMHVWPDSTNYLADMYTVLKDPIRIFDRKSPVYTIWLIINHLTFGKILGFIGFQDSGDYFSIKVFFNDIIPPIFFQNILGILSALICFRITSKINTRLAYAVTLLTFLNPTTLAIENAILRESLAIFFILGGFALFLKTAQQNRPMLGFISGILFVLAYQNRSELIIIYAILCFVLFLYILLTKQNLWKSMVLFCLPLILSIAFTGYSMIYKSAVKNYGGQFGVAIVGLKSKCYFYESPAFPELIRNIQKRAIQCKNERKAPCDAPAPSVFVLKSFMEEEIDKYIIGRKLVDISNSQDIASNRGNLIDQIFLDLVKNNPICYAKSLLANVGYNLIHNVQNTTPILYDRDNYWISQNWNYYISPKMLVLYEGNSTYYKYIIYFFRTIELYTTQKVLFPFFFIGSIVILMLVRGKLFANDSDNALLLACILFISLAHLLFISVMADPVARFVYLVSPFTFAIEIIGVMGSYHWLKSRFLNQREMETEKV